MKDVVSPDSFIDCSLYYAIACSLQRRVWIGPKHMPIFPNQYVIMVGEPGVGKGLMIRPVNELLRHHLYNNKKALEPQAEPELAAAGTHMDDVRELMATLTQQIQPKKEKDIQYLIPVAPNRLTYEALVEHLQKSFRFIGYKDTNAAGELVTKRYTYHSLCFCLSELGSLLDSQTKTTVDFLIDVYDCVDYEYKTKHCGTNTVPKSCMSFYAGTTPQFMQESFDDKLIGQGFAARVLFIYETMPRFHRFSIPERNELQCQYWIDVLARVKTLSQLYGAMTYTPEALEFMTYFFEHVHPIKRTNTHPKLGPYYERKKLHTIKMAMAMHFCDNDDMTLTKTTCEAALNYLYNIEKKMHLALNFGGKNFLSRVAKDVEKFIEKENRPLQFVDIWKEFINDVRENELREVLDFLRRTNKVDYTEQVIGETRLLAYTKTNKRESEDNVNTTA